MLNKMKEIILDILLFIISYIALNIVGSIFYVEALVVFFLVLGEVFKMNGDKWNALFKFGRGTGFYLMMLLPYLVMLVVIFKVSEMWFDIINFQNNVLASLSVVALITLVMLFKFPKLKNMVNNKLLDRS